MVDVRKTLLATIRYYVFAHHLTFSGTQAKVCWTRRGM